MKINVKFRWPLIAARQANYRSTKKIPFKHNERKSFYRINFHPLGEPEAFICCVIPGEA
jgi:hypothetical protein